MSNPLLLRLPAVMERIGRSRSAVYSDIERGVIPPPIRTGRRCAAWPLDEIDAVIRARIAGRPEADIRDLVRRIVADRANADARSA